MKIQWNVSGVVLSGLVAAAVMAFAQPSLANKIMPTNFARTQSVNLSSGNLQYYGGAVVSAPKIYSIYWGSNVDSAVKGGMGAFYKALVTSDHLDWLGQYSTNIKAVDGRQGTNQTIGRGSYGGEFTINPANTKSNLDDQEIRVELEAQITAGHLPTPDANSLYMIHFPAGIAITIEGVTSCQQFCAYHEGFTSPKYGAVIYGVMPDLGSGMCSFGCGLGGSAFDSTTVAGSHEVMEAVTDAFPTAGNQPAFPQAWNTSDGQEIGDLCASTSAELKSAQATYTIQGEYDNSTSSCKTGSYSAPAFLRR